MSTLQDLLLHMPWWGAVIIVSAAVALFVSGNRRLDKTLQRVAVALFVVGVLLGVVSQLFPTEQQKLEKRTRRLILAIAAQAALEDSKRNWAEVRSLLDPNTILGVVPGQREMILAGDREQIIRQANRLCSIYGVHSASIRSLDSNRTETLITVSVDVETVQNRTRNQPIIGSYQLDYSEYGKNWVLEKITLVRLDRRPIDQLDLFRN